MEVSDLPHARQVLHLLCYILDTRASLGSVSGPLRKQSHSGILENPFPGIQSPLWILGLSPASFSACGTVSRFSLAFPASPSS